MGIDRNAPIPTRRTSVVALVVSFGLVTNWGRNLLTFRDGDTQYEVRNLVSPTLLGALGLRLLARPSDVDDSNVGAQHQIPELFPHGVQRPRCDRPEPLRSHGDG